MKALAAFLLVVGFIVAVICFTPTKKCSDCHCKSGGMCCCSGTHCIPDCDCQTCNCKE